MNKTFNDLGVSAPLLKAIDDMGFKTPTEVQSKAIPHILNNEDLIVMSKTGSGKTAVFGVSMLQMTDPEAEGPLGLILTPARELAVQVDSDIHKMAKYLKHKTTAVYGQHNINVETQTLKKGVSIVTGTPGRVFDHISHGSLVTKNIRFLVLDEADRMLDMGFLDQVVRIIKTLPKDRITLLFSATMPPEIHNICSRYMQNPTTIEIESQTKTVDTIHQVYYRVNYNEKNTQLNRLLIVEKPESCMIFCNTKAAVDRVQSFLTKKGYSSQALHGDIPQSKRLNTIQQFKQGKFHILVATDVAARGIHIEGLSLVINYDVPNDKDNYVHRIGRTGRAGHDGRAFSLVTGDDIISLYEIEEHIGALVQEEELPDESTFNKAMVEAEQWIKTNSLKDKAPRSTSSESTDIKKKSSYSKDPQKTPRSKPDYSKRPVAQGKPAGKPLSSEPRPERINKGNAIHSDKRPTKTTPVAAAGSSKPPIRSVSRHVSPNKTQGLPSNDLRRSAPVQSTNKVQTSGVVNSKSTANTSKTNKQSVIKRILNKIFGR